MHSSPHSRAAIWSRRSRLALLGATLGTLLLTCGCQKMLRNSDPNLQPIQEMLDQQLPIGSPSAKVALFLDTQGYPTQQSEKPNTIVAVIRKIDPQKIEPVTARVIFKFDAAGKLESYDMQRMFNQPIQ